MNILMSAELMATIIGTAITITALSSTILYPNKTLREEQKNTQRILKEGNKNTQRILEEGNKNTQEIFKGHKKILSEIACAVGKIRADTKANVKIHGCALVEGVTSIKGIEKLGDVIEYDPKLQICYYRPKKSVG